MSSTAAARVYLDEMHADSNSKIYSDIAKYQDLLSKWNIHADDRIYPMTVRTRDLFDMGVTIFEHLEPWKAYPEDYAAALCELCESYKNGLIGIGLPVHELPSMPDAAQKRS